MIPADIVNSKEIKVRQVLNDELNVAKVCAKTVPKKLTYEQKDNRKNICFDIIEWLTEKSDLLTSSKCPVSTVIFHQTSVFLCSNILRIHQISLHTTSICSQK